MSEPPPKTRHSQGSTTSIEPKHPPPRWFERLMWTLHRSLYEATRGRLGLRRARTDRWGVLRLHTVGRHSGKERTVLLGYIEDGSDLILLVMNGWAEPLPAWWLNLVARPEAIVDLPDGQREVRARVATVEERPRLWDRWAEVGDDLDALAASIERETPIAILEPR